MKTLLCRGIDRRVLAEAVETLKDGYIIIYPTDTIYALGCDALNNRAVERLCRIKDINPEKNLLSIVCSDISQASEYTRIDNKAFKILKNYTPGPYTFILPAATKLPKIFKGRKSVGIRIPDNEFAKALANELGNPIMTASVHLPTEDSDIIEWVNAEIIAEDFGHYDDITLAIDGGEGNTLGSTIIDLTDSSTPTVVRRGAGEYSED